VSVHVYWIEICMLCATAAERPAWLEKQRLKDAEKARQAKQASEPKKVLCGYCSVSHRICILNEVRDTHFDVLTDLVHRPGHTP
jgi:hypothetical protein